MKDNQEYNNCLSTFRTINDIMIRNDINFEIILLPYEYQLREEYSTLEMPQEKIKKSFENIGIKKVLDPYDEFKFSGIESKNFYLYADGIHFSKLGHKKLFQYLLNHLE